MKKYLSMSALAALLLGSAFVQSSAKAADVDFRVTVTNVAATGTFTFTNDVDPTVSSFDLDSVLVGGSASTATTYTLDYVAGGITNLAAVTKTSNSNRLMTVTNVPRFLVGDKVTLRSSDTNTFTSKLNGRRR